MNHRYIGSDINQVQPVLLSHIKGQKQVINALQVYMDAYFKIRATSPTPNASFGPVALVGPSGTGKTLVAQAVHAELGNLRRCQTNGQILNQRGELSSLFLNADEHTTIFIDEAHGLNTKSQNILLTVISEGFLPVPGVRHVIPLKPFTLIIATTHEYLLQDALRNRVRIYCRFRHYSVPDLVEIVRQRANTLGWKCESEEVLRRIASRAKGTARLALNRNLQMCWQVSQSNDRHCITAQDVHEAFHHLQVDALGLEEIDRQYLQVLARGEYTALNVVSSQLGLPSKTIQDVIEPYLIREQFVTKNSNSMRGLTLKAKQHLKTIDQPHSVEGTTDGNLSIQ
jgi:holliday junction DNA helicase RuvB